MGFQLLVWREDETKESAREWLKKYGASLKSREYPASALSMTHTILLAEYGYAVITKQEIFQKLSVTPGLGFETGTTIDDVIERLIDLRLLRKVA